MTGRTSPETERENFIKAMKHLDCVEMPDAWGRPMFQHSHVQAMWDGWKARAAFDHAPTAQQRIAAPGNDQLSKLWNAIVENTKGDGFWIGEILLTTLEREVGFNPAALTDTSTLGNSK
jgi:hypothetical protein